jgi:hypothetical protein
MILQKQNEHINGKENIIIPSEHIKKFRKDEETGI